MPSYFQIKSNVNIIQESHKWPLVKLMKFFSPSAYLDLPEITIDKYDNEFKKKKFYKCIFVEIKVRVVTNQSKQHKKQNTQKTIPRIIFLKHILKKNIFRNILKNSISG